MRLFLTLFALLATFAPALDATPPVIEFEGALAAPASPRSDSAHLLYVAPGAAETVEEEADEEEDATVVVQAVLDCTPAGEYRAAEAWLHAFLRRSAHFCTGPPSL